MTPVAVMGSKKLPPAPLPHFDNNNITNEAENLKGRIALGIYFNNLTTFIEQ